MEGHDVRLKAPFTSILSGPTSSGKTYLLKRLIEHRRSVCFPEPVEVIYCYAIYQPIFDTMEGVQFHEGMLDVEARIPRDGKHRWLIVDDLMEDAGKGDTTNNLFTKQSHHLNVSVFFVTQNFFIKQMRTMSINSHYLFIYKNPRDSSSITHLSKQIYPLNGKFMMDAYRDATSKPYSFLLVDLKQSTPENMRLIGSYLSSTDPMCVYVPK